MGDIRFTPQPTPNPNAYKFVASQTIHDGPAKTFYSHEAAKSDQLAARLFELSGVTGVMILNDFCSVNQDGSQEWPLLAPKIEAILSETLG